MRDTMCGDRMNSQTNSNKQMLQLFFIALKCDTFDSFLFKIAAIFFIKKGSKKTFNREQIDLCVTAEHWISFLFIINCIV